MAQRYQFYRDALTVLFVRTTFAVSAQWSCGLSRVEARLA
jgi:hypothetical protein